MNTTSIFQKEIKLQGIESTAIKCCDLSFKLGKNEPLSNNDLLFLMGVFSLSDTLHESKRQLYIYVNDKINDLRRELIKVKNLFNPQPSTIDDLSDIIDKLNCSFQYFKASIDAAR